jgi:dTDP-4-dehydrorhamnose 3,5-epimerase
VKVRKLAIMEALEFSPQIYPDHRGSFREWFNLEKIDRDLPFLFPVAQGNISHSKLGVIRGLHFSNSPKGQRKLVTCTFGRVLDVLVDLRLGSPTYLVKEYVSLDPMQGKSVYIPAGVGHGFVSQAEESIVCYMLSSEYDPETEQTIYPFDVELDIDWNTKNPILSDRDTSAHSLAQARALGLLHFY